MVEGLLYKEESWLTSIRGNEIGIGRDKSSRYTIRYFEHRSLFFLTRLQHQLRPNIFVEVFLGDCLQL